MMSINELSRQVLDQVEIDMLAWQTMARLVRGETIQIEGKYLRLMRTMSQRAEALESQDVISVPEKNDWLALALFAKDRQRFLQTCERAKQTRNVVYFQAEPWLRYVIQSDVDMNTQ